MRPNVNGELTDGDDEMETMNGDYELQKPIAHTSIWLGKKESDFCIELYGA